MFLAVQCQPAGKASNCNEKLWPYGSPVLPVDERLAVACRTGTQKIWSVITTFDGVAAVLFDPRRLDDLVRRLTEGLPPDASLLKEDISQNVKSMMTSALSRMDVVTREEFDVQKAVLLRTREKLERLEARLAELEAGDDSNPV